MLKQLALDLPGFGNVNNPQNLRFSGAENTTLGYVLSEFFTVMFYGGAFLMLAYLAWGILAYIIARGEKEHLAKARQRINWAIIGFIFMIASVFIAQYAKSIFDTNPQIRNFNRVTPISTPK